MIAGGGPPGPALPFPEKCPQDNDCRNQGCDGNRYHKPGRSFRRWCSRQRGGQGRQDRSSPRSYRPCNRLADRKNAAGDDVPPGIEFLYRQDCERPGSIRRNSPVSGHDDANVTVCSVGEELPVDKCNRSGCSLPGCVPAIKRNLNCPLCSGQVCLHLERMPRCERGGTRGNDRVRCDNLLLPARNKRGIGQKGDRGKDNGGGYGRNAHKTYSQYNGKMRESVGHGIYRSRVYGKGDRAVGIKKLENRRVI